MTARVREGTGRVRLTVLTVFLAAMGSATASAQSNDPIPESSARGLPRSAPRDLNAADKARLAWQMQTAPAADNTNSAALEDVMTRDQIIEEFDVFGLANPVPGTRAQQTTAIPVPRVLPVDPGVLRFRPVQRIRQMVRADLYEHFDLYLYINKAPKGVWAQRMFVFERRPNGQFQLLYRWLGSTGREKNERYFTTTPVGIFKLDPHRFRKMYYSVQWGGVAMPFAMFIDFSYAARKSGVAIHGTRGRTENYLGRRASGGCIRLSVDNARMLYYLIGTNYRGMVPEFAFDRERGHTSKTGKLVLDENGNPVLKPGFRVLLIVDYVTN